MFERVRDFMRRFGQRVPEPFVPQVPPDDVVRNRLRWQLEETMELLFACFPADLDRRLIRRAWNDLNAVIQEARVGVDLVSYADANADIRYIADGNDVAAGTDSRPLDEEVADSNDTKTAPDAPGGKVMKGPHYRQPRIAECLRRQGWKG